jgi:hypothetical protein
MNTLLISLTVLVSSWMIMWGLIQVGRGLAAPSTHLIKLGRIGAEWEQMKLKDGWKVNINERR